MKKILLLLLAVLLSLSASCASAPQSTTAQTEETQPAVSVVAPVSSAPASVSAPASSAAVPSTTVAKPPAQTGFYSPLTGLPVSQELSKQRPVAVMVNNIKASMPQIGISQADVIYEALAEGGITRLMALFLDYKNVGTVGSVRSARDYYLDFAQIHDAIFIHAGGSELAYSQIKSRGINALDGVRTTVSGVFWRDAERRKTMAYEHTMVTSGEKILSGIRKMKYRTENEADFQSSLKFNTQAVELSGSSGTYIKIPNSKSYVAELTYDAQQGLYLKNQFGKPHVDGANGQQLAFTNVLVLYTQQKTVDDYGRLGIDFTGSGKGYYLCSGKAVPIQWSRNDRDGGVTLTHTDGSALKLNPGKSYISIASDKIYSQTIIK